MFATEAIITGGRFKMSRSVEVKVAVVIVAVHLRPVADHFVVLGGAGATVLMGAAVRSCKTGDELVQEKHTRWCSTDKSCKAYMVQNYRAGNNSPNLLMKFSF